MHLDGVRAELGSQLRATRAQLEAVPANGIGYAVLADLARDEDVDAAREGLGFVESEVVFNYLGQFAAGERGGSFVGPRRRRSHALRIDALVRDGALRVRFDHGTRQLDATVVEALAARFVQTLREIVAHCVAGAAAARFPLAALEPADVARLQATYPALQDVYPCTGMQQGLLIHGAREPGAYVTQMRLTLEGVDPARLRAAWQSLVQRHAILRTAFADVGGASLLQLVMDDVALPWHEVDLRADASGLDALLDAERMRPFDTGAAPLMRLLLARVGDDRWLHAWTYHHALIDGWSMAHLLQELLAAATAPDAAPPARATAYRDYIAWLQSRDHAASARYWKHAFHGVAIGAAASLPLRAADAPPRAAEQKAHAVELSAAATAQLVKLARSEGVGLGTLMLAAWGLLVAKHNAEPQVLFGYSTSGRPAALPDVEHTAGLFINSLPICLSIDGAQTLSAWLAQIQRASSLDHDDHAHVALGEIQRHAGVQPGQSLFDSLVVVENYPVDRSAASAGAMRVVDVEGVERNGFGLTLVAYPGARLNLKLVYQAAQFDDDTTAAMLRQLEQLLGPMAAGAGRTVSELSVLSAEERALAIHGWNDTAADYAVDSSIHALVEAQAAVRGDALALVGAGERWSYAELARRAAALAGWLTEQGVRPGDKVALSLEKGPDLIAAMLGILRAGAAYVPIAVDCPLDRRAFIAADAGIRHVVTHAVHLPQLDVPNLEALLLDDCPADAPAAAAVRVDPELDRVRHLHVGDDRRAEGRRDLAPQPRQLLRLVRAGGALRRRRPHLAVRAVHVRRVGGRDLRHARRRRRAAPAGRRADPGPARARAVPVRARHPLRRLPAELPAADRAGAGAGHADPADRRLGADAGAGAALGRALPLHQRLRPDRDDDPVVGLDVRARRRRCARAVDRQADREHRDVRRRPRRPALRARLRRRDLDRRRRRRPGLRQPARPDGAAVRRRPVPHRRPRLPHRRHGPPARRRRHRVRRPARPPGQAARLPHRIERDRGPAARARRGRRRGGRGARRRRRPEAATPGSCRTPAAPARPTGRRRCATSCGRRCPSTCCRRRSSSSTRCR